ncbi:MAG: tRNA (adenosine(37)-N6)-threonylcarbamoyltransferase complex ATPase subunit type 1 TsaE [Proteobacteria bacterium]|jgi:tRNA threonylcarbamoyladenosine biosynthesis protein TsaE|nr:tRNA (adenosine(37)-N6)-threonylcarbamoyltransferase complex ATPase subunit type 1 TsaE [Pseudomonadota bacterium]NLN62054.1 tRNA (adenosine(37)-N6)-threonylcarbamoyltransferase complex ATPase subunit type 1 TsaE [Myxococcales bacterium]
MITAQFHITNESEAAHFGRCLGQLLLPRDVIGLSGDLGAGKTFLSRAICEGLDFPPDVQVNSPTFTIIHEYEGGRLPVYHMDFYRLQGPRDLFDLALWDYYEGEGVCLVEWFDRFTDLWPEHALMLFIQLQEGEARTIEVRGAHRGAELVTALTERCSLLAAPTPTPAPTHDHL